MDAVIAWVKIKPGYENETLAMVATR